jgi:hypothetical protein
VLIFSNRKGNEFMIAIAKPAQRAAQFPEKEIEAALIEFWAEEALDPFASVSRMPAGTLYELLPALDSLTIAGGLLVIEKILGMEVPVRLVKAGGYRSREEMLKDLLPKLWKYYEKKQT